MSEVCLVLKPLYFLYAVFMRRLLRLSQYVVPRGGLFIIIIYLTAIGF
jgi:hypothetical protein